MNDLISRARMAIAVRAFCFPQQARVSGLAKKTIHASGSAV